MQEKILYLYEFLFYMYLVEKVLVIVIKSLFICNFYIQGLLENHHVVREHPVYTLYTVTNKKINKSTNR